MNGGKWKANEKTFLAGKSACLSYTALFMNATEKNKPGIDKEKSKRFGSYIFRRIQFSRRDKLSIVWKKQRYFIRIYCRC